MGEVSQTEWMPILQRLNDVMLRSKQFAGERAAEVISSGSWCGRAAATESEIYAAETRLGVKFPPSYRSFLSVSNGWRIFNSFVEQLLPVQEIDRYRVLDPRGFALDQSSHEYIVQMYGDHPVADEVYLDYETPEHNMAIRHQYYGDSLLISRGFESEIVLLNPFVVSPEGEWETIFSACWIPGNERFRSFRDYVDKVVCDEEQFLASDSTDSRPKSNVLSNPPNLFQGDE